jgi:alkylation response protein AidB-like acyl-CoA dehydrogenase
VQDTIEGLQEIRELANQFAVDRLRPHVERWDHDRSVDADVHAQLAELGFHGMLVPEANGGLGFPLATFAAVIEEIAYGEAAVACGLAASGIVATALAGGGNGSAALAALATGERTGAVQLTADGDAMPTALDGTPPRLDGEARWVLRGAGADLILLNARTPDGAVLHVVHGDAAGASAGEREETLGLRPARIETVRFAGTETIDRLQPAASAQVHAVMHLGMAAIAAGISRAALEHATGYADVREQFSRKLRAFEGIRVKLADMAARVAATRALVGAAAIDHNARTAAQAKVFGSEAAMWVTTQAVQIFGGYGYMRDYPVEKLMRDAKATEVLGGTNDACRAIIAAALYND